LTAALLGLLLPGCGEAPAPDEKPNVLHPLPATAFDPLATGTITGEVIWQGDVPVVRPFVAPVSPLSERVGEPKRSWPNPLAPVIDPATHGVVGAVVYLRGVDPSKARPWDHPPVRVEQRHHQFQVRQGNATGLVGFVRRGDPIAMISLENDFHALQARGAAFFTLVFPDPDQEQTRRLDRRGIVELRSNCGYFWMRAYLFVDDHPYYALTDGRGRFRLPQVPAGDYELVCWLPSWKEQARERDAETWQITRLTFQPPIEVVQRIRVEQGGTVAARFVTSEANFK
jgi:hypothetical protein